MKNFVKNLLIAISISQKNFIKLIRENVLGLIWLFLTPLLYSVFFLLVKSSISGGDTLLQDLKVSAFNAFIGLLLIQLWFQIIQDTSNIVRKNRNSLRALNVTLTPFVLSASFDAVIHILIRIIIIALALFIFHSVQPLSSLNFLALLLSTFTFLTSSIFLGLLLAPWATLFNDVRSFLSSSLMPTALLSPIFYFPVKADGSFLFWVNNILPFSTVQAVVSETLFRGETIYMNPLIFWLVVSLLGCGLFSYLVKHQTPILLERLGS